MPRGPVSLGRRGLLLGAVGVSSLTLAGCGIHLEDDAPHVPLVPRRTPIGGETVLLALLRNSRELAAAVATWKTGPQVALAPVLATIHHQQAEVVAALLGDAHVPADLIAAAAPTPVTTGATAGPTATVGATATAGATITALERSPLVDAPALAAAPAPLLATVAATLAQHYAAAAVLGGTTPRLGPAGSSTGTASTAPTTTAPSATASPSAEATTRAPGGRWPAADLLALLGATRSAVYGFEVVAAQGDKAGRALALRTLATLTAIQSEQEAALPAQAPPAPVGYPLPFTVTTPALARRLAGRLALRLRAAYGSGLGAAAQGPVPFLDLVGWLGQVEVLVHDWGGALVPFPGMTTP